MGMLLQDASTLKPGDVLLVAVELKDKQTGNPFWWKSFRVVTRVVGRRHTGCEVLHLKLHPDFEKDTRVLEFGEVRAGRMVVELVPSDTYPQGVAAMWTKGLTLGWFKLEGDG